MKKLLITLAVASGLCAAAHADTLVEGFESGNLNAYTSYAAFGSGQTTATVAAAYAHDGNFGLGLNGDNWYLRTTPSVTISQGSTFSAWIRFQDLDSRAYLGFGSSASGTYAAVLGPNTNSLLLQYDAPLTTTTFTDLNTVAQTYAINTWYNVKVSWAVGGLITEQLYASNGTTLLNTVSVTDNRVTTGSIVFRGFGDTGDVVAFDTVAIVPEPGSLALVGCGVAGLAGYVVRRRRMRAAC